MKAACIGKKFLTTEQMYAIMKNNNNAHLQKLKIDDVAVGLAAAIFHARFLNLQKISGLIY